MRCCKLEVLIKPSKLGIEIQPPVVKEYIGAIPYEGSYEVTPTQETQYLYTDGKAMFDNVTINPIPSNYGLITYNGAVLTVS